MKKLFTSIVVALCAMSVNAQETIAIEETSYEAGQTLSSDNCTLTLGAGDTWTAKAAVLGDFTAYVSGKGNPKDADDLGYVRDSKNLPVKGTYYVVKAKTAGTVSVAVVLNAEKSFYVIEEDGTSLDNSALSLVDKTGANIELGENNGKECSVAAKFYGNVSFKVAANKSYYVLCTGSKLGFYGLTFTAGGETAIANISAEKANVNAPVYNLNGQQVSKDYKGVVVQNGKKYYRR